MAPGIWVARWAGCIPPAIQQYTLALPGARFERTRGKNCNVSSFLYKTNDVSQNHEPHHRRQHQHQ